MDILHPSTIEERLLRLLVKGPQRTTALLAELQRIEPITKQGFYAALRAMHAQEVITIAKKIVSINTTWIYRMDRVINEMGKAFISPLGHKDIFNISSFHAGDTATFHFTTIYQLDTFWGHIHNILHSNLPIHEPLMICDPHYWFFVARPQTERDLLEYMTNAGRQFFMVVSGDSPIDREIKKFFNTDWLQYNFKKFHDKNNYYVSVIGDYVIEGWLDVRICKKIEKLFNTNEAINPRLQHILSDILTLKGKNRLKISCNPKKAALLKKSFGKDFYIKKPKPIASEK